MADKDFVPGLIARRHPSAPSFVICNLSIKREEMLKWLSGKSDEWINIDVKRAKSGKVYAEVSTFGKKSEPEPF